MCDHNNKLLLLIYFTVVANSDVLPKKIDAFKDLQKSLMVISKAGHTMELSCKKNLRKLVKKITHKTCTDLVKAQGDWLL